MYIIINHKKVGYTVASRHGTMFPSQGPPAGGHRHHPTHTHSATPSWKPRHVTDEGPKTSDDVLSSRHLSHYFFSDLSNLFLLPLLLSDSQAGNHHDSAWPRIDDRQTGVQASAFIHPAQPLSLDPAPLV